MIGLLQPSALDRDHREAFWKLHADMLTMIARAGSFEIHPLTHFYIELAHAQHDCRWAITLTLASTVEALAATSMTAEDRKSEFSDALLQSMKTHLLVGKDDIGLRDHLLNNLGPVSKRGVLAFMRGLAAQGVVNPDHVQTLSKVRNSVMHGEMVEPWSDKLLARLPNSQSRVGRGVASGGLFTIWWVFAFSSPRQS